MRVLPFELRAPQTSRSPVTARTELPKREAKSSRRGKRDNGKGRALPPPPDPRRSPNAQTIRRVPDIGQKPSPRPISGEMARKPRRHRVSRPGGNVTGITPYVEGL